MMSFKDSEECEEFAIDAQGVVNTTVRLVICSLRAISMIKVKNVDSASTVWWGRV